MAMVFPETRREVNNPAKTGKNASAPLSPQASHRKLRQSHGELPKQPDTVASR